MKNEFERLERFKQKINEEIQNQEINDGIKESYRKIIDSYSELSDAYNYIIDFKRTYEEDSYYKQNFRSYEKEIESIQTKINELKNKILRLKKENPISNGWNNTIEYFKLLDLYEEFNEEIDQCKKDIRSIMYYHKLILIQALLSANQFEELFSLENEFAEYTLEINGYNCFVHTEKGKDIPTINHSKLSLFSIASIYGSIIDKFENKLIKK